MASSSPESGNSLSAGQADSRVKPSMHKSGEGHDGAEDTLKALSLFLADDMRACNQAIIERMQSSVPLIPQLGAHIVAAGGKRLRPLLTLASARLCGYVPGPEDQRHVGLAACVEFIHTATLLHDDVVDESALRRGMASANALFGNQASVLVGDFLFARSFQLMTDDGSLRIMAILSAASATIAEGEVLQMSTQNDLSTPIERYLEVIHGKTAALFAAACRVGAVVAGCGAAEEEALERFGTNLGMAFQLVDDALDYAADQQLLGKTVGDDLKEGKTTLPVLAAYAAGTEEERVFWRRVIEEGEHGDEDLSHALALIARRGGIEKTHDYAADYARKAVEALSIFPDSLLKTLLTDTVTYTVRRLR